MDLVEGGPREPFFPPSAGRDKEPWGYKQNKTYLHYLKKINFVHPYNTGIFLLISNV